MKRLGFLAMLLASILIISQATTQQTTQETTPQATPQTTQQQVGQAGQVGQQQTTPQWADPRLDEVEDIALVRFANFSPNAGNVEIILMRDGQTWTFTQPAMQPRFGQQQVGQQEAGQEAGMAMQPAQEQAPQASTPQPGAVQQPGQQAQDDTAAIQQEASAAQQEQQQQAAQQQTQEPGQEPVQQPGQEQPVGQQQEQQQPAQQPGQQQTQQPGQEQMTGTATLEIYVEPEDAVISVAGPFQLAGQFQGSYRLSNLPEGSYMITVSRLGFEPQEQQVDLAEGDTQTIEISLQEAAGEAAQGQRQEVQPEPEEPATTLMPQPEPAEPVAEPTVTEPAVTEPAVTEPADPVETDPTPPAEVQVQPQPAPMERRMAHPTNLAYQDITGYIMLPAGEYEVSVVPATQPVGQQFDQQQTQQQVTTQEQVGQQPVTQQPATFGVYETTINLAAGNYYTVAAVGFVPGDPAIDAQVEQDDGGFFGWLSGLFGGDDADDFEFRLAFYEDTPGNLPPAGNALVRVVHAAPGTGAVEVRAWRGIATMTQPATSQQTTQPVAGQQQVQQPATTQTGEQQAQEPAATLPATGQQQQLGQPGQRDPTWTTRQWDDRTDRTVAAAAYLEASPYEEVRAYAYDLEVFVTGREEGQMATQVFTDATFEPGGIYTVFVTGTDFANYPLSSLVTIDALVIGEPLHEQGWQQPGQMQPGMQPGQMQQQGP